MELIMLKHIIDGSIIYFDLGSNVRSSIKYNILC